MKREMEKNIPGPSRRPRRQSSVNLNDVLTEMQRSGSIYFLEFLTQSGISTRTSNQLATLALPPPFVEEYGDMFEQHVILRVHRSCGQSSRPWVVQLSVIVTPMDEVHVEFADGWEEFAADNRLEEGDSLIFLLKEDLRSEFEVLLFRGPRGIPYFPQKPRHSSPDSSSDSEEEESGSMYEEEEEREGPNVSDSERNIYQQSPVRAPVVRHDRDEHAEFPGFRKRLTATNIRRPDRPYSNNSAQFGFPNSFVETHGAHLQAPRVKLQGVYEDSPVYDVSCWRSRCLKRYENVLGLHLGTAEWSEFVNENGLQEGQELQFSLIADSYFQVRKVY